MAKSSEPLPTLPLSRERVLEAAIYLADRAGLETVSMRKLAQQLGVQAMSLYNHVANKEDLIDGMVDRVVAEIEIPRRGSDWKAALRQRATSAYRVLRQHPWATLAMMSRVNVGPAMLRYVDATLGCLVAAGFPYGLADQAWNAIDSHVYGFTLQQLNFPFEEDEYAEAARQYVDMLPADVYPYLHRLTHQVIAGRHSGIHDFEFGLELILDGLERRLTRENPD